MSGIRDIVKQFAYAEMVKKYMKKPVVVEAIQFDGTNQQEILDWIVFCGGHATYNEFRKTIAVTTIDSIGYVGIGDYVVKGTRGEFYGVNYDLFADLYSEV